MFTSKKWHLVLCDKNEIYLLMKLPTSGVMFSQLLNYSTALTYQNMLEYCIYPGIATPVASIKCLNTNARNMGNKQNELEISVQLRGHDLIVVLETQ